MYVATDEQIPLCLNCYLKVSQLQQAQLENNERIMNFALDEMDAVTGFPLSGPRFPARPRPVQISGIKMNNIKVSNSVVGTINTGSIGTVDQSISALIQTGEPALADAIKQLSEAVIGSGDLTQNQKNELIESLSVIAGEAASPKERHRKTVVASLLERATQITSVASDITDVCQKLWPVIQAAFN